jgi:dihydropteroate synthase
VEFLLAFFFFVFSRADERPFNFLPALEVGHSRFSFVSRVEKAQQPMRRGAAALLLTCAAAGAGIWFVHDAQVKERAALHAGVLRDAELLAAKAAERAAAANAKN